MELDANSLIAPLLAALVTIYGYREARRGRREAALQQVAANKLAEEKQELDTLRAVIDNERTEADRALVQRNEARSEADAERTRRIEAETALRLSEEQAARNARRYTSDIAALTAIVRDEVAREAARTEYAIQLAERDKEHHT